jgi:hypothetical protein
MSPTPPATARLRAQLLEFLKFRVLASQEGFFEAWIRDGELDTGAFRGWLTPLWPAAADLDAAALLQTLEQARLLYVDTPPARRS